MASSELILKSGPAVVLHAGEATTFGGHGLELDLMVGDRRCRVILVFQTDGEVDDVAVRTERLDDGYRLVCVNFDGPDGRGSSQPVLLGGVGDQLLMLHFRVFRYGRTVDRTVHYTVYLVPRPDA